MAISVSGTTDAIASGSLAGDAKGRLDEDLNRFMNLLVTQLQNQDPLDPMDANEFTSQLVQFASVEQQIYQNSNLEKLISLQQSTQVGDMVSYIGNDVEAFGKALNLEVGRPVEFSYTLEPGAVGTQISIQDADGRIVFQQEGAIESGRHDLTWDGTTKDGGLAPPGVYAVTVTATDSQGELMSVGQTVTGRVSGASALDGEVSLFIGDIRVPLDEIITVRKPAENPVVN